MVTYSDTIPSLETFRERHSDAKYIMFLDSPYDEPSVTVFHDDEEARQDLLETFGTEKTSWRITDFYVEEKRSFTVTSYPDPENDPDRVEKRAMSGVGVHFRGRFTYWFTTEDQAEAFFVVVINTLTGYSISSVKA